MTPEQQLIAIAEACGYRQYHQKGGDGAWEGYTPDGKFFFLEDLPDYLNDLNAMHEAEKVLTLKRVSDYKEHLKRLTLENHNNAQGFVFHATAAQRAEAFLRTIGKWTDTP